MISKLQTNCLKKQILDLRKSLKIKAVCDEASVEQGLIEVAKNKMNDIRHEMDKTQNYRRKTCLENVSLTLKKNLFFPQPDTVRKDKNSSK